MKLIKFNYKNLESYDVEMRFGDYILNERDCIWKDDELYVLEEEVERFEELYSSYKDWVESGDCWDGLCEFDEEYEWLMNKISGENV